MIKHLIIAISLFFIATLNLSASDNTPSPDDSARPFKVSYMGNVEAGHTFLWDNFLRNTSGYVTLTTTHGVRITPYLFTGLGIGAWLGYYSGGCSMFLPLFANVRATLPSGKFRPFIDLKGGTLNSLNSFVGPSIGCKFAWGNRAGVYLSFGTNYIINRYHSAFDGLSLKLGFDF